MPLPKLRPDTDPADAEALMDQARKASDLLKALSHETRLLILCLLSEGEKSVSELEDILDMPQATVSQQLARLRFDRLVTARRDGRVRLATLGVVAKGLVANPMIVSIALGLAWSATGWPLPGPADATLALLGAAATPGALFAIGASLAARSAERLSVAAWLSFAKLVLHPAAVAVAVLVLFPVEPFAAGMLIATAAMPVAGNVYILAQHYGVAPQRVSASILISTAAAVFTLSFVIAKVAVATG